MLLNIISNLLDYSYSPKLPNHYLKNQDNSEKLEMIIGEINYRYLVTEAITLTGH
jgi:hypothetical protein